MAGIQRKLVHKQFNSPMGLYSQANVKATLNRELKAFGADGIEVDEEITKPLNLANSAVLRAVEEEEQQAKCADFLSSARPSRSRQRQSQSPHHALHNQLLDQIKTEYLSHQNDLFIDRDTVLRINRLSTCRHLLKRDHSWPPVEADVVTVHSPPILSKTHSIDVLREKFNSPTRLTEPTTKVTRQRVQVEGISLQQQHQPVTSSNSTQVARTRTTTGKEDEAVHYQTAKTKGFSAPETKAADLDIGLVAPKREYYEQLTQQRLSTPATGKPRAPVRPRLKRQSYSLDRGRSRKRAVALGGATELPPPKPRNGTSAGSCNGTPKVQRRSIKLATEVKICYDTDDEEEPKASCRHSPSAVIDLEAMPLPATPSQRAAAAAGKLTTKTHGSLPNEASTVIDNLAIKQQQQQQLALALAASKSQPGSQLQPEATERIIPVTLSVETSRSVRPCSQQASAEQIYDDACNYLRQDQQQQEPSNRMQQNDKDDATQPATYVSATTGIKLQRQESAPRLKTQSSLNLASSIPTPPPMPAPPAPPLLRVKTKLDEVDRQARRQGGIYCCTPEPDQTKQHEAHVEIAQLEAKYAHIQQSITEHLRQIDTYMENAKTALQRTVQTTSAVPTPPAPAPAPPTPTPKPVTSVHNKNNELWDLFSTQQSPVLAVESPLQAILRQIYCRAAGMQLAPKEQAALEPVHASVPAENVPIVERALEDLHRIAVALDSEEHELLHVQHKTTPTAATAEHVVVEEEEQREEQTKQEGQTAALQSDAEEQDFSLEFKHVSDVIANYEQLAAGKEQLAQAKDQELSTEEAVKSSRNEQKSNINKEHDAENAAKVAGSAGCAHTKSDAEDIPGSWCSVCGECRDSPHGWGKLNKADQWRFDNLHNEPLANYKSTYEIRSPYVSRQISWEETQQQQQLPEEQLPQQRNVVEIVTTNAIAAPESTEPRQLSSSPRPLSPRKSPALLLPIADIAQRWTSPLPLLPKTSTTTTAKPVHTHVPQLEGHNIGLLVRTATEPLQLSMYASSSMLSSTPPGTPRCNSQPPPFEFLMQREAIPQAESSDHFEPRFKSLASTEELPHAAREHSLNRSFDNVSPRPYIGIEGYKRVAWPPASEERIVREFTPQPATQSPAPGSGGYYPLQPAAQPAGSSAVPAQGPIYNNVQQRTQQPPQPQPQQHQHQSNQNLYGPSTNYASNGGTPATVAGLAASAIQVPANNSSYAQQPIQYTQAQFGRQHSREPAAAPATAADNYAQYPQQQPQQLEQRLPYQPGHPYQQQPLQPLQQQQPSSQSINQTGPGWKHIGAPLPKTHSEFGVGGVGPAAASPYQQQHLQQQYQQQQQQYRAPSQDNYQQQQAPQHWQQQQQVQPQQQQLQQQQPQQHLPQSQVNQQARYQTSPYQQQQQQQQPQQQQPNYTQQNDGANYAQPQYNSYSQPQQQLLPQQQQQQQQQLPYSQDQTDQQHSYRDASPGIITLRKETPVSQKPAQVYTSQPAAVSYQGGSKLRGDLKWPPPEYKEAAVRENEERRLLALGPVCRPRRVNRDYTSFFAQHQLNSAYPSYKVPPGTQHMFA